MEYKSIMLTAIIEFFAVMGMLLLYAIVASRFGETYFAEYSTIRRYVSSAQPIVMLGLTVAVPRYVSLSSVANEGRRQQDQFFSAGLVILLISLSLFALICLLFEEKLGILLFGSQGNNYVSEMCVFMCGLSAHQMLYSYYRGRQQFLKVNLLQMLNLVIAPLAAFSIMPNISGALMWVGFSNLAVVLILMLVVENIITTTSLKSIWKVLYFGVQRVPVAIGLMFLFSLPTVYSTRILDGVTVGYISFAISMVMMVSYIISPISIVYFPKINCLKAEKEFESLRKVTLKYLLLSVAVALLAILFSYSFLGYLSKVFPEELSSLNIDLIKVSIIGSLGYMVFYSMRIIIDTLFVKDFNSMTTLVVAGGLYVAYYWVGKPTTGEGVVMYFVVSILLLGLVTLFPVFRFLMDRK